MELENKKRIQMSASAYLAKLGKKRMRSNKSINPARIRKTKEEEKKKFTEEEMKREKLVRPIGDVRFMQIIKKAGIRFTKKSKPYNCDIHVKGPTWEPKMQMCAKQQLETEELLVNLRERQNAQVLVESDGVLNEEQKIEQGTLKQQLKMEHTRLVDKAKQLQNSQRIYTGKKDEFDNHKRQFKVCRKRVGAI